MYMYTCTHVFNIHFKMRDITLLDRFTMKSIILLEKRFTCLVTLALGQKQHNCNTR